MTLKPHWLLLFAGLALGACTHTPQPVHYFAEGKPAKLSDWQVVFRDGDTLALNARVVPYDLNTPLFSDYAHKLRTIWMPEHAAAKYAAEQAFDFPVGTIISKTFYYPRPKTGGNATSVARTYDQSHDFAGEGLDLRNVHLIETRCPRREQGCKRFRTSEYAADPVNPRAPAT